MGSRFGTLKLAADRLSATKTDEIPLHNVHPKSRLTKDALNKPNRLDYANVAEESSLLGVLLGEPITQAPQMEALTKAVAAAMTPLTTHFLSFTERQVEAGRSAVEQVNTSTDLL